MLSSDRNYFEHIRQRASQELRHIGSGAVSWGVIGQFLEMVRSSESWKQAGANSFTEYVRSLAPLSVATLWRYYAAARHFKQLSEELPKGKIPKSSLESLPHSVSPENIELLAKLSRVAPPRVLEPMIERVLDGTMTREELRRTWQAFRPALAGRTARGRGGVIPRVDQKDPQQYDRMLEGVVLNALDVSGPSWTGCETPSVYRLFLQVAPDPDPGHLVLPSHFNAVAVLRRKPEAPLELHAVECVGTIHDAAVWTMLSRAEQYCDYVYLASHPETGSFPRIPKSVGLLGVKADRIVVERGATRTKNPARRADLVAALLGYALGG